MGYGKEFASCSERVGKSLEIFSQDVLRSVWKKNLFVIHVKDDKEDLIQEGTVAMGGGCSKGERLGSTPDTARAKRHL